ncbi:hypothetical protein [Arsenophonus nasoniae]|uniref:Uncharacterized protein n=1 Tax=Arsenophonus nasoniae TaxID=638 RepID=A0AA95KCV1_9GAMM|nr:hypothetical protein [Arsenophonus nasoniae]WGM00908.1 hypothetical protein QE210_13780 [Arsenophonus nasoniae]
MESTKVTIHELISAAPGWLVSEGDTSYPIISWARCRVLWTNDKYEDISRLISDNRILPCIFDGSQIKPLVEFQDVAWVNPY